MVKGTRLGMLDLENNALKGVLAGYLKHPFYNFSDEDAMVDGKKVYIMRPCMIHGPGNKGNLNLLYGVVSKVFPGHWVPSRTDVRSRASETRRR